jgi:hypothetical protein
LETFLKSVCYDGTKTLRATLKEWTSPHLNGHWDAIYDRIVNTITVNSSPLLIQFRSIKQDRKTWTGTKSIMVDPATYQYKPHHGMPIDVVSMNATTITCKSLCENKYQEPVKISKRKT